MSQLDVAPAPKAPYKNEEIFEGNVFSLDLLGKNFENQALHMVIPNTVLSSDGNLYVGGKPIKIKQKGSMGILRLRKENEKILFQVKHENDKKILTRGKANQAILLNILSAGRIMTTGDCINLRKHSVGDFHHSVLLLKPGKFLKLVTERRGTTKNVFFEHASYGMIVRE